MKNFAAAATAAFLFWAFLCAGARAAEYQPTWESLDERPIPQWFDDAKFGIFIHWGVYSAPSWAPKGKYAEWYWHELRSGGSAVYGLTAFRKYGKMGGLVSPTQEFHYANYGKDFKYQEFAPMFKAEMFDPDQWAELFKKAGARYVVLTSKHHDGFCLWPAPDNKNWNSVDIGPKRDLAGDLSKAVKSKGLKMGFYYSLYEWYHKDYLNEPEKYVEEHMLPQMRDLVMRYEPSILWGDGEWDYTSDFWETKPFMAWLYNESPVRDDIVINDRWGQEVRSSHGGFFTSEYGHAAFGKEVDYSRKWEENRGIGSSFGYNRNESLEDYRTAEELIHQFIDIVSKGGNLLLDIGPTADGRIPVIMQERLLQIGKWLETNGEAIYGTHRWRETSDGDLVRYTAKDGAVYAIFFQWPGEKAALNAVEPSSDAKATMLGMPEAQLQWTYADGQMIIQIPESALASAGFQYAYALKITEAR